MPFSDLNLDDDPAQMKVLDELRNKYYGGSLLVRMRGDLRPRERGPVLAGLYNKITSRPPLPKGKTQTGRIKRVQNKVQKKPDSFFADLTIKEHPHESDKIDKLLEG